MYAADALRRIKTGCLCAHMFNSKEANLTRQQFIESMTKTALWIFLNKEIPKLNTSEQRSRSS